LYVVDAKKKVKTKKEMKLSQMRMGHNQWH